MLKGLWVWQWEDKKTPSLQILFSVVLKVSMSDGSQDAREFWTEQSNCLSLGVFILYPSQL